MTEIDSKVLLILDSAELGLTNISGDKNICSILLSASCGFDSRTGRNREAENSLKNQGFRLLSIFEKILLIEKLYVCL